jgi:hypothetical protein
MYRSIVPTVQGITYAAQQPNPSPLATFNGAYGTWQEAMKMDPSGSLIQSTAISAAASAAVLGVLGAFLPFFTAAEGAKWGALLGAGRGIYEWNKAARGQK